MNRERELALIQQCLDASQNKTTTTGPQSSLDRARYTCPQRFADEQQAVLKKVPSAWVHSSEIAEPNSYKRVQTPLGDVVVTRDSQGQAHSFYNSCRHRGSQLVTNDSGCQQRLVCPYHAWSYGCDGRLAGVPGEASCFPDLDKSQLGLIAIPCVEKYGLIWLCPDLATNADAEQRLDTYLGAMTEDLAWLNIGELHAYRSFTKTWRANWKVLAEGGMESYHFTVAHKQTIAPFFLNNTAVIDQINGHFRTTLPTKALALAASQAPEQQSIRAVSHISYNLIASCGLLVQDNHIDWIRALAISPNETVMTITSLIPNDPASLSDAARAHWDKNLKITETVLDEDFVIGEGIQRSFDSGALQSVHTGQPEWALKAFNDEIDRLMSAG